MDEEALIDAVTRLRTSDMTAAQVHALLAAEDATLTVAAVKKACSKASKRQPKAQPSLDAAAAAVADPASAPSNHKKEERAAKLKADTLKAAESQMLQLQKRWHDANGIIAPTASGGDFIRHAADRAMAGTLAAGEEPLRERCVADLATLEWLLLAHEGGAMQLPPGAQEIAQTRVASLQAVLGRRFDREAARACFSSAPGGAEEKLQAMKQADLERRANAPVIDNASTMDQASLDRALARSGALAATQGSGGEIDDVD